MGLFDEFQPYEASDYHLSRLDPDVRSRWEMMAQEYYDATGEPLRMRSGYRSAEHQARLYAADPYSGYVAPAGNSTHEQGKAIDLDKNQVPRLEELGLIDKYFNRPLMGQTKSGIREPWHLEHPDARQNPIFNTRKPGVLERVIDWLGPNQAQAAGGLFDEFETAPNQGGGMFDEFDLPPQAELQPQRPRIAVPFSSPETSFWPEKYKVGNLLQGAGKYFGQDVTSDTLAQFAEPAGEMVGQAIDLPFVPLRKGLELLHKTAIEPHRERTIKEWAEAMKPGGALEGAGAAAPEAFAALPSQEAFVPTMEFALAPAYLRMISKSIGLFNELGPAFRRHAPDIFFKYTAKGGLPVPLSPDEVATKLMAMEGPERAEMARKYPQFREVMEEMTSLVSKKREPYSPEFAGRMQSAGEGLPFPENLGETFTMKEPPPILRKAPDLYTTPVEGIEPEVWVKGRGKVTMTPETFRRRLLGMAEDLPESAGLRTSPPITMPGQMPVVPEWLQRKAVVEPEITPAQTIPPTEIIQPAASGEVAPESQVGRGVGEVEPTRKVERPGKLFSGGPDTSELFNKIKNKIVKQRKLTIDKPAFDELFIDRKDAKAFLKTEGHDPNNYLIRKTKDNNFTIHERVPRVPLYEDMADISAKLADAPDLNAWALGAKREKGSLEPALGTFQRLERHAPGITEKLWYRAHELDTQAEARYQDFLAELKPFESGLGFRSSKNIDAWAVAQQEHGPETLAAMKVRVKPLTNEELAIYDFGRKVYEETLPEINEARVLAGKQPIPHREDYAPFIRKFNELIMEGGDPTSIDPEYFHPLATPFKYAKARIGGTRPLELDFLRHLKQYMRSAYRHIELSPHIATVREMVNKIELPKGEITLRDSSPTTANFLTKWADRVAGVKDESLGPLPDKIMDTIARNNVTATLGGLITTVVKQPSSMLQAWAKTSHDVGYGRSSRYMLAGIKDSMNPNKWAQAKAESKVLPTRELDTSLEGIRGKISSAAFTPVGFMDMQAAVASWWAARRAAAHMGLSKDAAIRYADMSVIRTQASASPIDRAPFQSNPAGRFMGQFQTFVINDFDFIKKEVLGINGPVDLSMAQKIARVMMFAGGAALVNVFYRDILGINPPLPEPIRAAGREIKSGKGIVKAGQSAIGEFTKMVPLLGGMQYGSGMMGAGPALLMDIGKLITGSDFAPSPYKIAGKLLGVPGTEQISKFAKASEGKISQREAIFGRQSKEKTKKRKSSGFGGF